MSPPQGTSPATASTTGQQPSRTSTHHGAAAPQHQPPPRGTSPAAPANTTDSSPTAPATTTRHQPSDTSQHHGQQPSDTSHHHREPARQHQPPPQGSSPTTPATTTGHQPGDTGQQHSAPARPHQPPPRAPASTTGSNPATPAYTARLGNGQAITSRLHNVKPPPVTVAAQRSIGITSPALTAHQVRGTHPARPPHIANAPKPRPQLAARVASSPTTPAGPLQAAHAIANSGQPSRRAMA